MRPPRLTDTQRLRLSRLEPALKAAARFGQYNKAVQITADVQTLLRATGHETRLQQAKAWLFEAALNADRLEVAEVGFIGIRKKVAPSTRIYIEATTLLAICYIRQKKLKQSEPFMAEVLHAGRNISSLQKRKAFLKAVHERFREEGALAALKGHGTEQLNGEQIESSAGFALQSRTEDELYADLGKSLPPQTIAFILKVDELAKYQLSDVEKKCLPLPQELLKPVEQGKTAFGGLKRVLWRSLCDPESDIYKVWFHEGVMAVLNRKWFGVSIAAYLLNLGIGIHALAVSLAALILKVGIEVFCDTSRPDGIMSLRG